MIFAFGLAASEMSSERKEIKIDFGDKQNKMNKIFTLVKKELMVDLRQKYLITGIVLYVFSTMYIAYLAFNNIINASTWNALIWLIVLFVSLTGIGKSFVQEADRSYYYYYTVSPNQLLIGKLIYYLIYELAIISLVILLSGILLGNPVKNQLLFIINLLLGGVGLAVAFTMTSSISSKSSNQSTMMAILSFPVIIPILLLAVTNSRKIIQGAVWNDISNNSITLIATIIIIIIVSFILFPYTWKN